MERDPTQPAARYLMVGGFLGAGKSTAILDLAGRLRAQGRRVGLITNDQSVGLVDTALMRWHGFAVEEITGGCFCCRFDSLTQAADRLAREEAPEVFLAEPVGSCTDLVATVSYPLRRLYGDRFTIAPLCVMVDPIRAQRILGLEEGPAFSEKVRYVYLKQLEEAELIAINKMDLLEPARLLTLRDELATRFANAQVLTVSAREGKGMDVLLDRLMQSTLGHRRAMDLDYNMYAEGEAELGWLNATVRLESPTPFDGETVMMDLAEGLRKALSAEGAQIAHLKMTLIPDDHGGHMALLNLVHNDIVPELSQSLPERLRQGTLIVNLRAEAPPELLSDTMRHSLQGAAAPLDELVARLEHMESFRPARPTPTWRMEDPAVLERHRAAT